MTQIQVLPPEDYGQLAGVSPWFKPNPKSSIVVVAEDGNEIVGHMCLVSPVHVEGIWVRPDKRGGTLFRRMFDRTESEAKKIGCTSSLIYSNSEDMDGYLLRLGYEQSTLRLWQKEII